MCIYIYIYIYICELTCLTYGSPKKNCVGAYAMISYSDAYV